MFSFGSGFGTDADDLADDREIVVGADRYRFHFLVFWAQFDPVVRDDEPLDGGFVVEHAFDESWQRRVVAAYRYPFFKDA